MRLKKANIVWFLRDLYGCERKGGGGGLGGVRDVNSFVGLLRVAWGYDGVVSL